MECFTLAVLLFGLLCLLSNKMGFPFCLSLGCWCLGRERLIVDLWIEAFWAIRDAPQGPRHLGAKASLVSYMSDYMSVRHNGELGDWLTKTRRQF